MQLQKLTIFQKETIVNTKVTHKWDDRIFCKYKEAENDKLYDSIDLLNYKAKMSIGILAVEWGIWRFDGIIDIADGLQRLEAAWAGNINILYVKKLEIESSVSTHNTDRIKGPVIALLYFLNSIFKRYSKGSIYLAQPVMKVCELSRYLSVDKKVFDTWLSEVLRKAHSVFPNEATYDEESEYYDASSEKPVPRAFFEPSFKYSEEESRKAIDTFLKGLDYTTNPYLNTPNDMIKAGFKGTPYTY